MPDNPTTELGAWLEKWATCESGVALPRQVLPAVPGKSQGTLREYLLRRVAVMPERKGNE